MLQTHCHSSVIGSQECQSQLVGSLSIASAELDKPKRRSIFIHTHLNGASLDQDAILIKLGALQAQLHDQKLAPVTLCHEPSSLLSPSARTLPPCLRSSCWLSTLIWWWCCCCCCCRGGEGGEGGEGSGCPLLAVSW